MNSGIRRAIKAVTPPILFSGARELFLKGRWQFTKSEQGEKDSDWYDASFDNHHHWKEHYTLSRYYFLWSVISDRIDRAEAESVLEIGCGPGQLACLLKDRKIRSYHGFDFSPKRIAYAEQSCPEYSFSVADALTTTLYDTVDYDTIICTEFLEHIRDDLEILKRIRSGTRFYGSVPNFPYASHVRHFRNGRNVMKRYRSCFVDLRVDAFRANETGIVFFILEGTII